MFAAPLARLRDFSTSASPRLVATLVVPPQAGHDSCIVDYSAEQSQMRTILSVGLTRAFSLDWISASGATADATIDDYLEVVDRAVEHSGGRVNLIGDCQDGWLASIYAALPPERVNTLTPCRGADRLPRRRTRDPRGAQRTHALAIFTSTRRSSPPAACSRVATWFPDSS